MAIGYHCIVYPKLKVLEATYQDVGTVWKGTLARRGILEV
jgi:hypothetical protein